MCALLSVAEGVLTSSSLFVALLTSDKYLAGSTVGRKAFLQAFV